MRSIVLVVLLALVAASCGGDDASDAGTADAATIDCPALLTWREAQQGYLDRLADIPIEEYEAPSDEVLNLGLTLGTILLEAAREATQSGCEEALFAGSDTLCAQVSLLTASGPAAESHLSNLERDCSN